ncbi:Alpha/Beta hydrolase protein [Cantharellus anzutake]|uniref:Alpha/Beta hydrolase protein n=1 Tax=Cantharellus anzutake TaxID=1750568 RepID=UPI001906E98D|nr:Alpha/Beta hydrolase protein [Cantharellus anzutake]KAF8342991.1 Alpha/Beta hydrolase protein [Cantharellus anzutake]
MSFYDLPAWKTSSFNGFKHKYLYIRSSDSSKPVILFLHGFPDGPLGFSATIPYFIHAGYGVLAPELLGYGDTSKPEEIQAYASKNICYILGALLKHENIEEKIIVLGHDFGSSLAARFVQFYPDLAKGLILASAGYSPPGKPFDPDVINAVLSPITGYENVGYIKFMSRPDAAQIIEDHFAAFVALGYAESQVWKERLCPTGAMEKTLKEDYICPMASWVTDDWKRDIAGFILHTGLEAPARWYQALVQGVHIPGEEGLNPNIGIPTLFLQTTEDAVMTGLFTPEGQAPYFSDFTSKPFKTGHWIFAEDPKGSATAILDWFKEKNF